MSGKGIRSSAFSAPDTTNLGHVRARSRTLDAARTGSALPLFLVTDFWFPKLGGMEQSLVNLCRYLPPSIQPTLLTGQRAPDGVRETDYFVHPVLRLAPDPDNGYYQQAFEWIARSPSPRVVHVFGFSYHWPEAQARFLHQVSRLPGTRLVMKVPTLGDARRSLSTTHQGVQAAVHCFIALSDALIAELAECGVPRSRIEPIPNGVCIDCYRPASPSERRRRRSEFGLPPGRLLVGFCGRFERRKRLDALVRAVGLLPPKRRPCLVLAGYTDSTFGTGVDVTGWLGDDVRLLPARLDTRPFYQAVDVYASASEAEGMSNAVLEAMASGLPILASDIPGHRELVVPGANGLLFPSGNEEALANCLLDLSRRTRGELREWGRASRQTAARRFNQAVVSRRYAELYERLVGLRPHQADKEAAR
jgi:glycosyltransferase involved in cell wall biosynthesis